MSGRAFGLCLRALALALGLLARPVSATPVDLELDCQGLSAELQASLEARARADLSLKRLEGWHLQVTCDGPRALVEFTPAGGLVSRREGALIGEPEDWVDRVLSLVHDAATTDETTDETAPPASTEFPAAHEGPEAATQPPDIGRPAERPEPLPRPPDGRPRGASSGRAVAVRLEAEASVGAEVWPAEPLVLVGPAAAAGIRVDRRFRVVPAAAAAWSVGSSHDVAVRLLEGGVDAVVGERWWLGLGGRIAWLRFEPQRPLSPITRTIVDPAFVARVGLSIPIGHGRLSASVGARAYMERHDVRVDGSVVLRVPNVAAIAAVGYGVELL